jgi:hypothetical protein
MRTLIYPGKLIKRGVKCLWVSPLKVFRGWEPALMIGDTLQGDTAGWVSARVSTHRALALQVG